MALTQEQLAILSDFTLSTDETMAALIATKTPATTDDDIEAAGGFLMAKEIIPDIVEVVASTSSRIVAPVDTVAVGTGASFLGLEDQIKRAIQSALDPLIDGILAMERRIVSTVTAPLGAIKDSIGNLGANIIGNIQAAVNATTDLLADLEDSVLAPMLGQIGTAVTLIGEIDDKVKSVVLDAVAPITAVTGSILDSVQGFATALRDTIPELGNVIGSAFGQAGDAIGNAVRGAFETFVEQTGLGGLKVIMGAIGRIGELADPQGAFSPDLVEKMGPTIANEFNPRAPQMLTLMIPFLNTLTQIIFTGGVERIQQASRGDANSGLLPISDMTSLQQRGLADPDEVRATAFRSGMNDTQLAHVFDITRQRPGTLDIIDYWRRELITDGTATNRLRDLGWSLDDVDLIKLSAFPPPPVQDLIRMAVREVFSPEIAEQFGQFEGQPEDYTKWAKRIGLNEEWARNYWAAHWQLPSILQGFEMLHRAAITEDDLDKLLIALDVMPFWRQPLKDISFRPFTRVDVRRMFALGVLDRAGVQRAYLDLGFNTEKAENMTEFTVRWVESTRKVEKDKERDLTKGDIIGLFNDGLLDETSAIRNLRTMGFDDDEADLLIGREVMQELQRDRKADIKLIVDQAKIKVLTFSEAQDALNGLDLTRKELERAMVEVQRATTERVRLPTKSDLDNWKELDLLSIVQYETELDNLGFPAKYVALYVEAIQLEEAEDLLAAEVREAKKDEPRTLTKGQLDALLRTEIIDSDEYVTGLEALRFAEGAISNFVIQITVQIEEARLAAEERAARGEEAAEREKLISRVVLGKLVLKEIISFTAYREGLRKLGFSPQSVDLLTSLLEQKIAAVSEEE